MRVADFTGQDTGGQGARIARALRDAGHDAHAFRGQADYLDWAADVTAEHFIARKWRKWFREIDIVHVHNKYRRANGWCAINPNARWVIHQHGRIPDMAPHLEADKQRGAFRVVSTLNLMAYVDHDPSRWIPAPLFLDEYVPGDLPTDEFVIAHSPTNRRYKRTELLLDIAKELRSEGYPVRIELIENVTHTESRYRRSLCHATFDQIHLSYGSASLEAWAFGQPSMVGMSDKTHAIITEAVGEAPYIRVDEGSLKFEILRLMDDEAYRKEAGKRGRAYMEAWHSSEVVASRLIALYEGLS